MDGNGTDNARVDSRQDIPILITVHRAPEVGVFRVTDCLAASMEGCGFICRNLHLLVLGTRELFGIATPLVGNLPAVSAGSSASAAGTVRSRGRRFRPTPAPYRLGERRARLSHEKKGATHKGQGNGSSDSMVGAATPGDGSVVMRRDRRLDGIAAPASVSTDLTR